MSKIPIVMDLISGILLAYDLFPKRGIFLSFHNWIKDNILNTDTNNPTIRRTIVFNIIVSFFIFLMILVWAWYKNSDQSQTNVWTELGLFTVGAILAWGLITLISILLSNLVGVFGIFVIGLVIGIVVLASMAKISLSSNLIAPFISFIYMCFLYPFAMTLADGIRRMLLIDKDKHFYIFGILGLALFVISKIIVLVV